MKKRNVIHFKALPTTCPWMGSVLLWLLLDRTTAPGWVWGAVGLFVVVVWIGWIASFFIEVNKLPNGFGDQA